MREAAVFALSQRPRDESVPALIRVARTHRDPHIRKTALFWLGQSRDPRAIELFEEILISRQAEIAQFPRLLRTYYRLQAHSTWWSRKGTLILHYRF